MRKTINISKVEDAFNDVYFKTLSNTKKGIIKSIAKCMLTRAGYKDFDWSYWYGLKIKK